ncbi:stress-response A/B barrel domain-containing protein UP3-like [Impatiens glandulifera]|uniref:stress-response A/B barrel domain-containing protein UP3-like n=1 Tax=Impatiens glandulifera TaxID=253017 RepID=UPI001FB05AFA|nr:stress-response A/B barrel domain-containing protein UP3-like [Impatiens glandulifera]
MVVDWVFDDFIVPIKLQPGSVIRATFLKLKEGSDKKERTLGVLAKLKEKISSIDQITYGENFSPARTNGFSIALIFVILGVSELKKLFLRENACRVKLNERVRDLLDDSLIVDFELPDGL